MRVLVVGGGGREHALCWAIAGSPLLSALFCAPGNPGTAACAENVAIAATDVAALVAWSTAQAIDLVVVGPEAPLVLGLADALGAAGIACCGPSAAAARVEGSKSYCKEICDAAGIPTALWERFDDAHAAVAFVRRRGVPIVIKADGLAAGKGVVVATSLAEAEQAIGDFMTAGTLGSAGHTLVIEEFMLGEEISLFALCDGQNAISLGAAQDHKRAGDGDTGPNTGGMGAYAPPPSFTAALEEQAMARIIRPALAELARRGTPFRGILFAGLMLTADGVKLIEFNARLGDPETQCLLPRLQSDLLPALVATTDGSLDAYSLRWRPVASIAVVMTLAAYPAASATGDVIHGVADAAALPDVQVFQSGTALLDGALVTAGGRVLSVVATAADLRAAREAAYRGVAAIAWRGAFCRRDIGWRALPAAD